MKSEKIKKIIISPQTSLKIAMRTLSAESGRILFIVDENDKLIGSLTDGDIRRAILNGVGFESAISGIMFKSPRFVRQADKNFEQEAKRYTIEEKLYAVPVLDKTNRIADILFWHDFSQDHPSGGHIRQAFTNPVVIMAGGKGTRLDPFTKILPKPLIPFGDKPIIERIMDRFSQCGFSNFILSLNYKKEFIKMYFKENRPSYNIEYIEEESYLGSAGSLGLLNDRIKETFFVCNCDILLENDFNNILLWHKGEKALITLIGCHKEITIPYGTLKVKEGRLEHITEKPKFDMIINTGVYIMEPQVLNFIPDGKPLDMNHLIEKVMPKGKITVYPICGGWFDLGQWKGYKESIYLLENGK